RPRRLSRAVAAPCRRAGAVRRAANRAFAARWARIADALRRTRAFPRHAPSRHHPPRARPLHRHARGTPVPAARRHGFGEARGWRGGHGGSSVVPARRRSCLRSRGRLRSSMWLDVPLGELAWLAAAIIVSGVVTGILAGLFGIGGGAVIVPALYEVFRIL